MGQAARVFQWLSLAQFLPCFPVWLSFDCIGLCVLSLTPGQEVFGSSVVSCPECYQESSSDGQPTLPLSAASPCGVRRKEKKIRTGGSVIKKEQKQTNTTCPKLKCRFHFSTTSKHTLYQVGTQTGRHLGNQP